jgi:autotransporter-associated beta strand protein
MNRNAQYLRTLFAFSIAALAYALMAGNTHATTRTKGNNTTNLNLTGSWSAGVVPGSGDIALWDATVTGANTVSLGANLNFGEIQITNPGGNVTINAGNTLTLSGVSGVGIQMPSATVDLTLNCAITLSAAQVWSIGSGRTLTLGGSAAVDNGGFLLAITGAGNTTIGTVISGTGGLTKGSGSPGTLSLTGANTYTGSTTVLGGVLNIQNDTALGTTAGGTTVNSGALQIQGGITVGAESTVLNGTGIAAGGALRNISGNNTYGGLVTLGSATRINSDAGTLTLSNTGTITGANFGLTVGGAGNTTINSIIATTNGTLTKDGAGILTLTGANTYVGLTTLSLGTLTLAGSNNSAGQTTVAAGTLQLGSATNGGLASGQINFNGGTIQSDSSTARSTTNAVSLGGATATFGAGGDLTFGAVTFSGGDRTVVVNNAITIVSSLAPDATTSRAFTKQGAGAFLVTGNKTNTGTTQIDAGTLGVAGTFTSGNVTLNGGVLGVGGGFFRSLGTASNQVQWTNSGGFAAYGPSPTWGNGSNNLNLDIGGASGTLIWNSTPNFLATGQTLILGSTISNGTVLFNNPINLNGANRTVQVVHSTTAPVGNYDASFGGIISSAAGSLTITGDGIVYTSIVHTYGGTTTINGGTLRLDDNPFFTPGTPRLANTSGIMINSGGTLLFGQTLSQTSTDRLNNSPMTLNGGTFNTGGFSEHGANNNTAGIGALTLQSSSIIDMASGTSILAFANSSANSAAWGIGKSLDIWNWTGTPTTGGGTDQLYFGSDATGLTASQLLEIHFYSGAGTGLYGGPTAILANGEVVPIPEPSTWVAGGLAFSGLLLIHRRRPFRLLKHA